MAEREQRLDDIESSVADLRDEADEIWLSEIANQLQQVTHTLEIMNNKIEGLENLIKGVRRSTIWSDIPAFNVGFITGLIVALILAWLEAN